MASFPVSSTVATRRTGRSRFDRADGHEPRRGERAERLADDVGRELGEEHPLEAAPRASRMRDDLPEHELGVAPIPLPGRESPRRRREAAGTPRAIARGTPRAAQVAITSPSGAR
jgi:hypothetical protein